MLQKPNEIKVYTKINEQVNSIERLRYQQKSTTFGTDLILPVCN